jgi:hypothetical protein
MIVIAFENVCPRSRETAMRIFALPAAPLNTVHIAWTWSRFGLPAMLLTATHSLSSTWPRVRLVWLLLGSRSRPPLPLIQCRPRSSD